MEIIVNGADFSANNLGNIYTYGIVNINTNEGTTNSVYFPVTAESNFAQPSVGFVSKNTPIGVTQVHKMLSSVGVSGKDQRFFYPGSSANTTKGNKYLTIGFWFNKSLVSNIPNYAFCLMPTRGKSVIISNTDRPNMLGDVTNHTYSLASGADTYVSSVVGSSKVKEEKVIDGSTWVFIQVNFTFNWKEGISQQPFFQYFDAGVGNYMLSSGATNVQTEIAGLTVVEGNVNLRPNVVYPFE